MAGSRLSERVRRIARTGVLSLAGALSIGLVAPLATFAPPEAVADSRVGPYADTIRVSGAGWGHGRGMSQYGAYGAAVKGLSWTQILSFYYPGTKRATIAASKQVRVWITADNDNALTVLPMRGLRLRDASTGKFWAIPTGSKYTQWRITISGGNNVLQYRTSSGTWVKVAPALSAAHRWSLDANPTYGYVKVVLPKGHVRDLRGRVGLSVSGSTVRTVNELGIDWYLRGVVPAEMPTSWDPDAVRAQAVAARSYVTYKVEHASSSAVYDICDTTACQVYRGGADRYRGVKTAYETREGNAAIHDTGHVILTYGGKVALTEFSSSNGGHTRAGWLPYQVSKTDPYDGVMRNQLWTMSITSREFQGVFPSIGTFTGIQITQRDAGGRWGGYVRSVAVKGTKATVTVSGDRFVSLFGLRSDLFNLTGGVAPSGAAYARWQVSGGVTGWMGAPTSSEVAVTGGSWVAFGSTGIYVATGKKGYAVNGEIESLYRSIGATKSPLGFPVAYSEAGPVSGSRQQQFQHGSIYWSKATHAHELHGALNTAYRASSGDGARLGLPTTNVTTSSTGATSAKFQHGSIACTPAGRCTVRYS